MTPEFSSRRSVRLPDYDYGGFGAYFVTLCTWDRHGYFGQVTGDGVVLNEAGMLVTECWKAIPAHMPSVELDEFIVMPNHLHGIIWITGTSKRATPWVAPTDESERPPGPIPGSLGAVIGAFKSVTTKRLGIFPELPSRIWQRNYYEEIIENDESLNRIREYIIANPSRWAEDPYQQ